MDGEAGAAQDIDLTFTGGVLNARVSTPPALGQGPGGDGSAPAGGDGTLPGPPAEGGAPGGGAGADGSGLAPYNPDGGGGAPIEGGAPTAGGAGGAPTAGGAPRSGGAPPPPTSASAGADSGGLLFIGFGLGLLAVLGIVWLRKHRGETAPARSSDVVQMPEPGFLQPDFPALSAGLSAWVAPGDDGNFRQALLVQLADRHRVLVVARADVVIRPVLGGPVYRVVGVRPGVVGGVAETLADEAGPPLIVLIVLPSADAAALKEYRELLPSALGGVVLLETAAAVDLPRVDVAVREGGWRLTHGERVVLVGPELA